MDHKSLQVLLLINICMMLCTALPLSHRQPGESVYLSKKFFSDEERSIPDDFSKGEHGEELSENLLRDMLDWNKRGLGEVKQSQATVEKRGPRRCSTAVGGGRCRTGRDESTEEAEARRELVLAKKEPGYAQMNAIDIKKMKEYDIPI